MTVSDMKKEFVANELTALLKKVDKDFDKAEYIMRDDYMELVIIKDGTGRELYRINEDYTPFVCEEHINGYNEKLQNFNLRYDVVKIAFFEGQLEALSAVLNPPANIDWIWQE